MSNKRRKTNDYWVRVKSVIEEHQEKLDLMRDQMRKMQYKIDMEMERIWEKQFQALIQTENESPLDRSESIAKELAETKYIETIPQICVSWDQLNGEKYREMCALVQMDIARLPNENMLRVRNCVYYPPMIYFRSALQYGNYCQFFFISVETTVDLITCSTLDTCKTDGYIIDLKSSFGEGKDWFLEYSGEIIDLVKIAKSIFLSLVPHICGPAQEKHGGVVGLICEYVHYSENQNDAYLKTISNLRRLY